MVHELAPQAPVVPNVLITGADRRAVIVANSVELEPRVTSVREPLDQDNRFSNWSGT